MEILIELKIKNLTHLENKIILGTVSGGSIFNWNGGQK